MYIGQLALKGLVAYSAWTRPDGDKGVFCVELISKSSTATLDVDVQHKNQADPDSSAATVASFTQITAAGVGIKEVTAGFKELIRLKFTVGSSLDAADDWAVFDVMATSWRKN